MLREDTIELTDTLIVKVPDVALAISYLMLANVLARLSAILTTNSLLNDTLFLRRRLVLSIIGILSDLMEVASCPDLLAILWGSLSRTRRICLRCEDQNGHHKQHQERYNSTLPHWVSP